MQDSLLLISPKTNNNMEKIKVGTRVEFQIQGVITGYRSNGVMAEICYKDPQTGNNRYFFVPSEVLDDGVYPIPEEDPNDPMVTITHVHEAIDPIVCRKSELHDVGMRIYLGHEKGGDYEFTKCLWVLEQEDEEGVRLDSIVNYPSMEKRHEVKVIGDCKCTWPGCNHKPNCRDRV